MYYLKRIIRIFRLLFIFDPWAKSVFDLKDQFKEEVNVTSKGVELIPFNLFLPKGSFEFVIKSYERLKNFSKHTSINCNIENNLFFININGTRLNPTTEEEFFIIQEVFFEGSYNFTFTNPSIVIDIGMNVGTASLFFAAHQEVTHVYSFEPFQPTFQQALINLKLNPSLEKKINASSFGLSDQEETVDVMYDYENKGQVGIYGTSKIRSEVKEEKKIKIELKPVAKHIESILNKHPETAVVVKMDCEGSEYSIIKSLDEAGLLKKINVFMIEWHERGTKEITYRLSANGFSSFFTESIHKKVGMIYAVR